MLCTKEWYCCLVIVSVVSVQGARALYTWSELKNYTVA